MKKESITKKLLRFFAVSGGAVLITAGVFAISESEEITGRTLINNFIFFISGTALIYSGLKHKKTKQD